MKKNTKYKVTSSVMIIVVVALVIAVNAFITVLTGKIPIKFDMTPNKVYGISDSTKDFLKNYNTDTKITVLASSSAEDKNVRTILDKYTQSSAKITVENVDLQSNPTFGKQYVSGSDSLSSYYLIVDGNNRHKLFKQSDLYEVDSQQQSVSGINVENKVTNALKYIAATSDLKAYMISGHSEISASGMQQKLKDDNYAVSDLNLLTGDIPADASLIISFNPVSDFTVEETAKLDKYLEKGGHAQFYFAAEKASGLTNLYEYLKKWGIGVNDDLIVEGGSDNVLSTGNSYLFIPDIQTDDITTELTKNKKLLAYGINSKSLSEVFENSNGIAVKPLLKSSKSSYATTDMEKGGMPDGAQKQAYNIALLATNSAKKSSVYVSGTDMYLSENESTLSQFGLANFDYFSAVCAGMQGKADSITISSKSLQSDKITIKDSTVHILMAVFIVLIPLIILIYGIIVWIRRRHM